MTSVSYHRPHLDLNQPRDSATPEAVARVPSEAGDEGAPQEDNPELSEDETRPSKEGVDDPTASTANTSTGNSEKDPKARRPTKGTEPFEKWERDEMEKLLGQTNGHLGAHFLIFPHDGRD